MTLNSSCAGKHEINFHITSCLCIEFLSETILMSDNNQIFGKSGGHALDYYYDSTLFWRI